MNIYDIINRARSLKEEYRLDSVTPERLGALHEDTLKYINEYQLLASSPAIHKTYASISAMQSSSSPKSDLTGKPLKAGQLVVIVPADPSDSTAGDVYRYDGPSGNTSKWTFVAKIGAVPADAELSATSTNPPQNQAVTAKLTELESDTNAKLAELESEIDDIDFAVNGNKNVVLDVRTEEHPSSDDRIKLLVKKGDTISILVNLGTAQITSPTIVASLFKDGVAVQTSMAVSIGKAKEFTVENDADEIGFYIYRVTQFGTFDITIAGGSVFSKIEDVSEALELEKSNVSANKMDINSIRTNIYGYEKRASTNVEGSFVFPFNISKGERYVVKNLGVNAFTMYLAKSNSTSSSERVQTISVPEAGRQNTFVAEYDVEYINGYANGAIDFSIETYNEPISEILDEIDDIKRVSFDDVIPPSGYGQNYSLGFRVKKGEIINFSAENNSLGNGIKLMGKQGNGIYKILYERYSSFSDIDIVIDADYLDIAVQVASQTEGDTYVKAIVKNTTSAIIDDVSELNNHVGEWQRIVSVLTEHPSSQDEIYPILYKGDTFFASVTSPNESDAISFKVTYKDNTSESKTTYVNRKLSLKAAKDVKSVGFYYYPTKGGGDMIFSVEARMAKRVSHLETRLSNYGIMEDDIVSLQNKKEMPIVFKSMKGNNSLVLLHFSDIHGNGDRLKEIVDFGNYYKSYIDDTICTGDMVYRLYGDDFSFWSQNDANSILRVIGNHETFLTNNAPSSASSSDVYNKFIAQDISKWGVTSQVGKNYYYKDYHNSKIRMVVVDDYYVDDEQTSWLRETLSSAPVDYSILLVSHERYLRGEGVKCTFDTLNPSDGLVANWDDLRLLTEIVSEHQTNNNNVICWLCGHSHRDEMGFIADFPNILFIQISTASDSIGDAEHDRSLAKTKPLFNIIGFDATNKVIKIYRIGNHWEYSMRGKEVLSYDYERKEVLYNQ